MKSRGKVILMAVVILCSGALQYATLTRGHDWGDDFASYIMQARSIVEGHPRSFIEANRFTVERSTRMIGPTAAPWGTPALLAPLYRTFGMNLLALKSLNIACYVLFLVALAVFLRGRHPFPYLLLLVSFFAFNPIYLSYLDSVLSDIPFLLLSTVCIFLIGRVAVERRPLISRPADGVLLGVLLAAAFFVRSNGLVLVATLLAANGIAISRSLSARARPGSPRPTRLATALRAHGRGVFVDSVPYLLFVFLALAWGAVFPDGGGSNAQYFGSTSLATVLRHVRSYGKIPSDFYLGIPGPRLVYFASVPFLLAGIVRSARAECHVVFYVATSAVLLLIWPYTQGLRYVVPLMPFYVHYLFVGIRWAVEAVGARWRPFASAFAMGTLIIIAALFAKVSLSRAIDNMHAHRAAPVGPYMETAQAMFDFVKGGTGEDATIIFFKPRAMRMLTGRPSIAVDKAAEVERGDYVCFHVMKEPFYQLSLGDVVRLVQGGRLVSVYANPDFRVYRVIHSMGRA